MDDQTKAVRSKQFLDSRPVANIQRRVCEPLSHSLQSLQIPKGVARRPEENPSHVIVYADNFMPLPVEMFHGFRTNQSAAACYKNLHPLESILLPMRVNSTNAELWRTTFLEWRRSGWKAAFSVEEYRSHTVSISAPASSETLPFVPQAAQPGSRHTFPDRRKSAAARPSPQSRTSGSPFESGTEVFPAPRTPMAAFACPALPPESQAAIPYAAASSRHTEPRVPPLPRRV